MKKLIPALALFLLFSVPAFAWPACSGTWVQVPAGTSSQNGAIYTTGDNLTFQCQKTPAPNNSSQSQNQSQNTSVNSTQNTSNQNNSSSGSSSKSNSNASSQSNNANSNSNTNNLSPVLNATNSAQGGTSAATNNSSGNTSTYESNTTVDASKIPVATALAVAPPATSPCVVGFGGGVQTMAVGGSFSAGKIDKNCAILETARSFASMNARLAYCKTMLIDKYAKKAGITLEDCMRVPPPAAVVSAPSPAPQPVQPQVIVVPAPQPAPVPVVKSSGLLEDLGTFRVTRSYSTNLCPTVQTILGPRGIEILNRAVTLSANGEVILIGNVYTTAVATNYLRKHGVNRVVIRASDEQNSSVGVEIWSAE